MSAGAARAQERVSSEAATAEQRLAEDVGLERLRGALPQSTVREAQNTAELLQIGVGNNAVLDQRNLATLGNQAYITQAGAVNVLELVQQGSDNRTYLNQQGYDNRASFRQDGQGNSSTLSQRGAGNKLTGLVDGDGNQVNVRQDGYSNQVKSEIHQDGRTYNINQIGYNNTLTQLESAAQAAKGYSIEMRGSGINITIEQGKIR